jgi:hypothetical protein
MMASWWRTLLLILLATAAFLAATFPINQALHFVPETQHPSYRSLQGTLWSGSAEQLVIKNLALGKIHWTAQFPHRPALTYRWQIDSGHSIGKGSVDLFWTQKLSLHQVRAQFDVEKWLDMLLPVKLPLPVSGKAHLTLKQLDWENQTITDLQGQLDIHQLELSKQALGDFHIAFTTADNGDILATLSDQGGPLQVSGTITLSTDKRYRLSLLIGARNPQDPLNNLISFLGKSAPEGQRRITHSGAFSF